METHNLVRRLQGSIGSLYLATLGQLFPSFKLQHSRNTGYAGSRTLSMQEVWTPITRFSSTNNGFGQSGTLSQVLCTASTLNRITIFESKHTNSLRMEVGWDNLIWELHSSADFGSQSLVYTITKVLIASFPGHVWGWTVQAWIGYGGVELCGSGPNRVVHAVYLLCCHFRLVSLTIV